MIDLHYWTTPNGHKVTIFLEEAGLPTRSSRSISARASSSSGNFWRFLRTTAFPPSSITSPPGGGAPISVFESGAILLYLPRRPASSSPATCAARIDAIQWLFWQMGDLGPMAGQNNHFSNYARRENAVRDGSISQRGQPALRRARTSGWPIGVRRRRIFDRRHGELSLDRAARAAGPEASRISRISSAGSKRSVRGPRWCAPTRRPRRSIPIWAGIRTAEQRAILFGQTAASVERAAAQAGLTLKPDAGFSAARRRPCR